jgi:alcohol dehydrogenase
MTDSQQRAQLDLLARLNRRKEEPELAARIQTFELAPIYPGDRVVVLGAGRLGSLVIQVARLKGSRVIAVDPGPEARRRAKKLGAHDVMAPGSKLADDVRDATGGLGADVVVEASGSAAGFSAAVDLVRPRGTIALKTTCGQPSQVEATRLVVNEIQVSTSRCGPFGKALALMRDGRLKINPLIAAEYPLSSIDEAVRAAEGAGKILLRPD